MLFDLRNATIYDPVARGMAGIPYTCGCTAAREGVQATGEELKPFPHIGPAKVFDDTKVLRRAGGIWQDGF